LELEKALAQLMGQEEAIIYRWDYLQATQSLHGKMQQQRTLRTAAAGFEWELLTTRTQPATAQLRAA
jgi:hypothetical protein